jgi:hypothetical protein
MSVVSPPSSNGWTIPLSRKSRVRLPLNMELQITLRLRSWFFEIVLQIAFTTPIQPYAYCMWHLARQSIVDSDSYICYVYLLEPRLQHPPACWSASCQTFYLRNIQLHSVLYCSQHRLLAEADNSHNTQDILSQVDRHSCQLPAENFGQFLQKILRL